MQPKLLNCLLIAYPLLQFLSNSQTFPVKSIALDAIDSAFAEEMQRKSSAGLRYVWDQTVPLFRRPLVGNTARASFLMFGLFAASSGLFMWMPDILNVYINYKDESITICQVVDIIHRNRTAPDVLAEVDNCSVNIDGTIFMITTVMGVLFLLCYILNGAIINRVGKKLLLSKWTQPCAAVKRRRGVKRDTIMVNA